MQFMQFYLHKALTASICALCFFKHKCSDTSFWVVCLKFLSSLCSFVCFLAWEKHRKSSSRRDWSRGGVLPSKKLLRVCRWMESHFHSWTDYNGVTFSVELLEWGRKFLGVLG